MRSFLLFCLVPLLLSVVSCTDPTSDVGLNLLGDESTPQVKTTPVTSFSASSLVDITGAAPRVLVGEIEDPLTGQISANGFLDFTGTFSGSDSETIMSVQLKLSRNYNYGDTLEAVEFSLHQILTAWSQSGLQADTMLNIGPEILAVSTLDTLTTIDLPVSWINANEGILRGSEFESEFHGFALIGNGSSQVVGFNSASSMLELTSSNTSTIYTVNSTYTQIDRGGPLNIPDGLVLFQDGAGPAIGMNFALDEYTNLPINGVVLVFRADVATSQLTPVNFVRPMPEILQLVAVSRDDRGPAILVGQTTMNDNGEYLFSGPDVSTFFQRVLFGAQDYAHFELRAPVLSHSLNSILFHGSDAGDLSPRATIILSP